MCVGHSSSSKVLSSPHSVWIALNVERFITKCQTLIDVEIHVKKKFTAILRGISMVELSTICSNHANEKSTHCGVATGKETQFGAANAALLN